MVVSREQALPLDLVPLIFEQVDDLKTLSKIVEAYPGLLGSMLERQLTTLVPTLLHNAWSEEALSYAYTLLQTEERLPDKTELTIIMQSLIEDVGSDISPPISPSYRTAKRLADLTETIDFFVHFCTALWLADFPLAKQMPLSAGEDARIRRALLRFQLYAQIFHQPEATDEMVSDRDWEQRLHQQQYFWTRFTSVEIEECKCIYGLLFSTLSYMRPVQPSQTHCDKSSQRGLPLLHCVFAGSTISPLASSYADRFADYAFTGLDKLDPHDGNYFLPYRDFQNQVLPKTRKHTPSDACREENFGVVVYDRPMKYDPVVRQTHRAGWRLLGYCFWDEERVDCMLAEIRLGNRS